MTYFGDYLKEARGSLSLSQAAAKIGCTKAHLWELEAGRADNPGIKLLDAIGRTYAINVEYLAAAWAEGRSQDGTTDPIHRSGRNNDQPI